MIRRFIRALRSLWALGGCLDVIREDGGLALVPVGLVSFGAHGRPFGSLSVDKDTVYVYAVKAGANYERLAISYNTATDNFEIKMEVGGTGVRRRIKFGTGADAAAMIINADGTVDFPPLGVLRTDVPQLLSDTQRARFLANLS